MNRELCAYIDQSFVGTLSENTGVWSFQYDQAWVEQGYELSPGLPLTTARHEDGGTVRPVQWFFDNLLPEADARLQLMTYMKNGVTVGVDAWTILAHFGAESAGALTLLAPGNALPEAGLLPLSDDELEARIKAMPRQPLSAKAPKKMSLAGAQQKLAIVKIDGQLFEPTGTRASTHILKPDVLSGHYPCSAVNEWFSARLAQRMGLSVPQVELRYVPSPIYIIERFDRKGSGDQIDRLHTLDALQLLTLSAQAKYAESGIKALTDVLSKCRTSATARVTLFRWTLYNILIGNSDAHLKNISLIAGPGGYELAPHYDLLSTAAWARPELLGQGEATWSDTAMSFPIADALLYRDLRREHLKAFADQLGIGATSFNRELTKMVGGIEAAAAELEAQFEARTDVPATIRGSQLHMLRCIRYLPIATMAQQLKS
ncbi:HipA domain-containing protein [Massilia scottii]|uniref:HipA domain-containing protein n=1 Tax=Massilia scottii TaxID=3057166 RepID=UPI002796640F|nr:HipA domain-containing protein [Massilia sp. CCM 9029]MDQ1833855.1 HipA domain-containing protein [Massilia sp. CCM 9029]